MQTWSAKLNGAKSPQKKRLEKSIAGMPAGAVMYISTPREIDDYIKKIPYGRTVSARQLRDDLAQANGADVTCPLTTGIFLRIVAEAAFEAINNDNPKPPTPPTPFWRVIEPASSLSKKLSFDSAFIQRMRNEESGA